MGSLEMYDSFQPYSSDREEPARSAFAAMDPSSIAAARAAIERIRERHGRRSSRNAASATAPRSDRR